MVDIIVTQKKLTELVSSCLVHFVQQDQLPTKELQETAQIFFPHLHDYAQRMHFTGKAGTVLLVPSSDKELTTILLVGLGKAKNNFIPIEQFRRAVGTAIKTMQQRKIDAAIIFLPSASLFDVTVNYFAQQLAIIANMAAYRFDEFITDKERKVQQNLALEVITDDTAAEVERGLKVGTIIAQSVNKVRHWIDLPAKYLTPLELAEKASTIADRYNLKITIFNEQQVNELGMGGLAAVSVGSEVDCRFVILEYKTTKKDAPTICFVGKGITFDSGGLSLKPASYMETMKEDMSGAAAVIGAMEVLAQLKPDVNIVAITPLSENMPSGKATKPGDIIKFYNGKTAEVRNTDAEGRLILADALSYAVKHYKLDAIIDLATLTGACAHALGPFFAGMMSQYDTFVARVEEAAQLSGDRVWRLPFDNDYKVAIKSDVADICNIGNQKYKAGAITAGFFLQNFVDDVPWVHLDIAGTAFDVPDISYYSTGATGYGVRLLVELALHWKK